MANKDYKDQTKLEKIWNQVSGNVEGGRGFDAKQRESGKSPFKNPDAPIVKAGSFAKSHLRKQGDAVANIVKAPWEMMKWGVGERPASDAAYELQKRQKKKTGNKAKKTSSPLSPQPARTRGALPDFLREPEQHTMVQDDPWKMTEDASVNRPAFLGTFQGKPVFRDDPRLSGGKYDLDISGDLGVTPDELYGMFGRVPDRNQIVPTVEQYQQKMQYDKEVARAQEARNDPFRDIRPLSPDASLNERLNWAANLRNANAQAEMQSRRAKTQSDWQSVLAEQQGKDRRFNMEHNLKVQQHVDSLKENMIETSFKNEQEANKMQMFYDSLGQTDAHKQLDIMLELQGGSYSDFMQKFMNNVVTEKIRAGAGVSDNADLIADVQAWIQEGQDVWTLIHGKDEKKSSTAAEADKYMQGR